MTTTITKTPDGGRITCYEGSHGDWATYTHNAAGQETHYEDSNGGWCTRTYNAAGLVTRYEDSNGYWYTRTYNAAGQETHYENSNGGWYTLALADTYTLRVSASTPHIYWAGCRRFTREQAIKHWSTPREDNTPRAAAFLAAVINHKG
jgi:hypothetical protein